MPVVESPWLMVSPMILVGAGIVLMPIGARLHRAALAGLLFTAFSVATYALVQVTTLMLKQGAWHLVDSGGWRGATVAAKVPFVASVDPKTLVVLALVHFMGGLILVGARQAFGGGPRRTMAPASAAQRIGLLVLLGVVELVVVSDSASQVLAFAALASTVSSMVLLSSGGRTEDVHGAAAVFSLHRWSDAALVLAAVVLGLSSIPNEIRHISQFLVDTGVHTRIDSGLARGFSHAVIVNVAGFLVVTGLATRVFAIPFSGYLSGALGAPMPILVATHGLGSAVLGAVVVGRLTPLFVAGSYATTIFYVIFVGSAFFHAVGASISRDLVRIDVRIMMALSSMVSLAFVLREPQLALLGLVLITLVWPVSMLAGGAAIEALQGTSDVFHMGGLWRALRRTDAARALSTTAMSGFPGAVGFLFFTGLLLSTVTVPRGGRVMAAVVVVVAFLCSFASFRSLHLVFAGETTRGDAPARLVEVSAERWATWLVVALGALLAVPLLSMPAVVLDAVVPGAFAPLSAFLDPVVLATLRDDASVPAQTSTTASAVSFVLILSSSLFAFVISRLRYRRASLDIASLEKKTRFDPMSKWIDDDMRFAPLFSRTFVHPFQQFARVSTQVIRPLFVDGPLERIPQVTAAVIAVSSRLIHGGDLQRALLVVIGVVLFSMLLWGAR